MSWFGQNFHYFQIVRRKLEKQYSFQKQEDKSYGKETLFLWLLIYLKISESNYEPQGDSYKKNSYKSVLLEISSTNN